MDKNDIDFERLRKDLYDNSMAAAFVGGFGGAFFEAEDILKADEGELLRIAKNNGINLSKYF